MKGPAPTESPALSPSAEPAGAEPSSLPGNFTGEWHRTNTVKALSGTITMKEQTDSSFDFSFFGCYGANSGAIEGTAVITDKHRAEFQYSPEYDKTLSAKVEFSLGEEGMEVKLIDGDQAALGFGHNVFIDGEYTKSDPAYTDANIVDEILPGDAIKEKLRALLGEKVYEQMIFVVENGVRYQDDGLTYSGFLNGAGQGVDLLIRDNKIYCLAYGLDEDGLIYKLYTNDGDYNDKLPAFMRIERPDSALKFVCKP